MPTRMKLEFDGFRQLAERIDELDGRWALVAAVDDALTATQQIVQENLITAAAPYAIGGLKGYAKGEMYRSILKDKRVSWAGHIASVSVGFDLRTSGGKHSIFVMYGTEKMQKDTKIYNAILGRRTENAVHKKQEEVMRKYLQIGGAIHG